MSSNDSKYNADSGSGSDIKLPPISFLSGHGGQHNKLPPASNMGISSYLSHPTRSYSSQSPDFKDEHANKKLKFEEPDTEPMNSQRSTLLGLFNAANLSPNMGLIPNNEVQGNDRAAGQHSHASSNSFNCSHNNQGHTTQQGFVPHAHTNPHHHHHHHHHHHVRRNGEGESSPNGVPHIHSGSHVHILARGGEGTPVSDQDSAKAEQKDVVDNEKIMGELKDKENADSNPTQIEAESKIPKTENEQHEKQEKQEKHQHEKKNSQIVHDATESGEKCTIEIVTKHSQRIKPQPVTIDKSQILEIMGELFPDRHNLGTLVYNPTTTWSTLQTAQLTGLKQEHHERFQQIKEDYEDKLKEEYFRNSIKYIPMIPPFSNDYINHLLEIKIPYKFIKLFKEDLDDGNIPHKRQIWGGASGVYTDDSDVLLVLAHLGLFNGDISLKEWNEQWTSDDIITPLDAKKDANDIYGDLSVTILLLPPLPDYYGYYTNGINSRHWISYNKHNGLSYAVYDVKWEGYGSYLRDKMLFKRYQTELYGDIETTKAELSSKKGWTFNFEYYKQLKHKFENFDKQRHINKSKNSTTTGNN